MKTKKKTYTLLFFVLTVWGTIAYKIISALNPELPEIQQNTLIAKTSYKVETSVDTFSIQKVNRDPFLGTRTKKQVKKTAYKLKPITWKPITYQGVVKQKKAKQHVFIVTINGIQHLLKKGQVKDSVTLIYGNSKSVRMRYKNQTKTFSLKQE